MDFLEKVEKLPNNVRNFFVSDDVRLNLEKACFMYDLSEEKIGKIAKEIGLIFVGDLKLVDLPSLVSKNLSLAENISHGVAYEINRLIFNNFPEYFQDSKTLLDRWAGLKTAPVLSEDAAWKKVLVIEPWIIEAQREEAKKKEGEALDLKKLQESLIKITLKEALKTYAELGEQLITSEKIILANFPSPVRPSIKNWLSDYTFTMGYNKEHGGIERTDYLFHNANTKKLNVADRQKLSYLLKAFDENSLVTVNKTTKQLMFPALPAPPAPKLAAPEVPARRPAQAPFSPPKKNEPNLRFSSPQKMPFEKEKSGSLQPYRITPFDTGQQKEKEKPKSEELKSKNVINLKEQ